MVRIIRTFHSGNIVHMDLKAENLILFCMVVKIVDLGISKITNVLGQLGTTH